MVLTLFISQFSISRISRSALEIKQKTEETFDDLKKSFESFSKRSERLASKPNTKTSKLTPNDDSQHVQLINLEP
jgi:hypothetical protein